MRRQKTRNSSAQFRARREGAHDEGKNCSRCGVHDPNVSSAWAGHWNCDPCGGNIVSRKVANAGATEEAPGSARRARFLALRNKDQKPPAFSGHIPSFLDKPDPEVAARARLPGRPKPAKRAKPTIDPEAAKRKAQKEAMELLGLTEQQVADFQALLNAGNNR